MKIPTTQTPDNPNALYFRIMYREFFFGPFETEKQLVSALKQLDTDDPYWDYDCFCIHYGKNPLPDDFVRGFRFISKDQRNSIEEKRNKDWSFLKA